MFVEVYAMLAAVAATIILLATIVADEIKKEISSAKEEYIIMWVEDN